MAYPAREQAVDTLQYYLRTVYEAAGLKWTSDNNSEVAGIVDDLIDASKMEFRAELEAMEHKR